jgi:hypothetical protein
VEFLAKAENAEICPNTDDKFHFFKFKDAGQSVVCVDEGDNFEIKSKITTNDKKFKLYSADRNNN